MTRVLYVDVDDTLVRFAGPKRIPVPATIALVRDLHARGARLFCWSTGGADYARDTARELGIESCFEAFLPKPEILIDDAWRVRTLHPNEAASLTAATLLEKGS